MISFRLNGARREVNAPGDKRFLDVLREDCELPGTKEGCGEGECGACTILVDGRAVNACLMLACQARGREIVTIEGLETRGELSVIQRCFVENGAIQCGYCTPGMVMSAKALLLERENPNEQQIRAALAGNICRCSGYSQIIAAVRDAASRLKRAPVEQFSAENEPRQAGKPEDSAELPRAAGQNTEVFNPRDTRELAACLPKLKPGAVIVGGYTDLGVRFLKRPKPEQLLNVSLVDGLRGISAGDGFLRVGAAATFTDLEKYPLPDGFEALKQAAAGVGSKQIRNAATVGGNVMNASPAGDLQLCLFLLGASAELMAPDGSLLERPIEAVVTGSGKTSLAYNEVLTAVKIPVPAAGLRSAFWKLGYRKEVTIARINIAMSVSASGEKVDEVRFYLGAVAPVPTRVPEAEKILLENKWNPDAFEKLTKFLSAYLKQTVPAEFDRDYKTLAVKGAVHDILQMFPCWEGE